MELGWGVKDGGAMNRRAHGLEKLPNVEQLRCLGSFRGRLPAKEQIQNLLSSFFLSLL